MRRTVLAAFLFPLLLAAGAAPAQHGLLAPADGSKQFLAARGILVAPTPRESVSSLVDAGTIDCEGFDHIVVNLALEMKGPVEPGGAVGAIVLPDVGPYDRALRSLQLLPAAAEIVIPLEGTSAYLTSKQLRLDVGFPRYRVLLWNSGRTTVNAALSVWRAKS
jgi:hypothetical protein